jgi:RsiW-degrading membrane proteinase PrsW (M82 family)
MITSIFYASLAIIPVIIYLFIVYLTVPYKTLNIRMMLHYFIFGFFSVGMVIGFSYLFPSWYKVKFDNFLVALLYAAFIQVALIEEISKFISFKITEKVRSIERNIIMDQPISPMIYCGITALGFAFIENVKYAMDYGATILIVRSALSMILHFICGLIMGYWIALSRIEKKDVGKHSIFDYLVIKYNKFKIKIYTFIGIMCAVFIHGLFDFSIDLLGPYAMAYSLLLLMLISFIAYVCFYDIYNKMPNKRTRSKRL